MKKFTLKNLILLDIQDRRRRKVKSISLDLIHRIAGSMGYKQSYAERIMRRIVNNPYNKINTIYKYNNKKTVIGYKLI